MATPDTALAASPEARRTGRKPLWSCLAAAAMATVFWLAPGLQVLEERSRDGLTALVASAEPVPGVAVVDISEESLRAIGTWPWSRTQLADLVEHLLGPLGARGVALDMVLPEQGDAVGDGRLASLSQHAPLALAHVLDFTPRSVPIAIGAPAGVQAVAGSGQAQATGFVANHAGLAGARCVGHIGIQPDADGVLRHLHLRASASGRGYSTLSLALLECVQPELAARALANLPGAAGATWRVPFRNSLDAFLTVPAEAVLKDQVDPALLRGRFVLIGSSAVGLSDYVATPLQPVTAGVLVHAQVLGELLQASRAAGPGAARFGLALSAGALALGCLALGFALRRGVGVGLALLAVLAAAWLAGCAWAFGRGAAPAVLAPLAGLWAFGIAWLGLDFAEARRATRRALDTLSHYVAEPVLKLLVKQGLDRSLAPSRQEITVLVADMAGYTRLTAESTLEQSARVTTEFLEAITGPVLDSGGTLDRYTGDGLIAFWGAPLPRPDHAATAFDAALRMLDAVRTLNETRQARGEPPLAMRVGIESGQALVGDLGSSARSVYTAVGSCINLASRLQETARDIGEVLVLGPQARAGIQQPLRALGARPVRGLAEPLELFGLPAER